MQNFSYEQFLETQKSMYDQWQKGMKQFFADNTKEETAGFNQPEFYKKLFEASQEYWKKGFEDWTKQNQAAAASFATAMSDNTKGGAAPSGNAMFGNMFGGFNFDPAQYSKMMGGFSFDPTQFYKDMTSSAQDFWKKTDESKKTYAAMVDLWRQLAEDLAVQGNKGVQEIYEDWSRKYSAMIRSSITPNVPGYMKEFSEKMLDYFESSGAKWEENFKTWMNSGEDIWKGMEKVTAGNPNAYLEFMEALKKSYQETYGQIANQPLFGKDMEFWRRYRESFDRFAKYNIAAAGFYTAMFEVIRGSTRKVVEEFMAKAASGEQSKTFEEFYKYWAKQVSATYDKVLFSEQYARLAGSMVDEMARFKSAYNELWEFYLAQLPLAKKTYMDALYKTVYELKKEIRSLKKEIKGNE